LEKPYPQRQRMLGRARALNEISDGWVSVLITTWARARLCMWVTEQTTESG
jgi:hypothetical protein